MAKETVIYTEDGQYQIINCIPIQQTNVTSILLSVKSCDNARLLFTGNDITYRPAYQIIIGRILSSTVISRISFCPNSVNSDCIFETVDTPGILDCKNSRSFWVQWDVGISFGKGDVVNSNVLATFKNWDASVKRHFLGIKTLSNNRDKWIFKSGKNNKNTIIRAKNRKNIFQG